MGQQLKISLLTLCMALLCAAAHAQDRIYKTNGEAIDAKVTFVGSKAVWYERADSTGNGKQKLSKKEIIRIVYQNGATDVFGLSPQAAGTATVPKNKTRTNKNTFSIIPAVYNQSSDRTINDAGLGIAYERKLDRRGFVNLNIPFMICASSYKDYNNAVVFNANNGLYTFSQYPIVYQATYTSCYVMPGIKLYFMPDTRAVRYAIGVSFLGMFGGEPEGVHDNAQYYQVSNNATYHYAMYGLMLSNSLNITASRHFILGLDLGLGLPVSDNRYTNFTGGTNEVLSNFVQIGCRIGYRY